MSQLGPLAGGVFLAGGALAGKIFAESDWAKAAADIAANLISGKAAELFGCAVESFRTGRNGDIEESMRLAAKQALAGLRTEAADEFAPWFEDWDNYLTRTPAEVLFAGTGDADPMVLQYGDDEFRALWWSRMEPALVRWRKAENAGFIQLDLNSGVDPLPDPLRTLLRERLPEALRTEHDHVLRDPNLSRSWIAFQEHVYRETLNSLREIQQQLDRVEAGQSEIKAILAGKLPARTVWNIPRPTQNFQDRPELMNRMDAALARSGRTALTALHGLAGIGKSQMARHFADLHRAEYAAGVWINAESEISLLSSFSALAPLLGVAPEKDQQVLTAQAINALSAREKWLVVFDNAESRDAVRGYVERLSGNGHVLITSRNQQWDGVAEPVSVTQWSMDESARFLLERTGQTDRASAEQLARDLDGLVLALEHAVAFMRVGDGTSLSGYRGMWRSKLRSSPGGHEYADSVAAALGLSLDRVEMECPPAYQLLCLFAWLAPDRIPKKELLEAGSARLPETLWKAFADRDRWDETMETLGRYSLAGRERAEGQVSGYSLHRLVQQVVRDRQTAAGERAQWIKAACDLVNEAFPFDSGEPAFWAVSEALLPHARAIRECMREAAGPEDAPASLGRLLNHAGAYLRVRGLYGEARAFRELALESDLRQFGPDHPTVAVSRSNLSNILRDLGEHQESRKQIELALASDLRQFGPDHPTVAVRRSNLSGILGALGEHQEARKQIELALESDLRQFGPDHPAVAVRRSNLSNILGALGEHQEARKQIELALDIFRAKLPGGHPHIRAAEAIRTGLA